MQPCPPQQVRPGSSNIEALLAEKTRPVQRKKKFLTSAGLALIAVVAFSACSNSIKDTGSKSSAADAGSRDAGSQAPTSDSGSPVDAGEQTPSPSDNNNDDDDNGPENGNAEGMIKLNQVGFLPGSHKIALIPNVAATTFAVIEAETGDEVFSGDLTDAATWPPAQESVRIADFTDLTVNGRYRIRVAGVDDSWPFSIASDAYAALNAAAIKAFYFNRASAELLAEHAGIHARPAGHPDTEVQVHASAESDERPAGTMISAAKGWYDAGDFGKYVVNSGITLHNLLSAYEHFPDYYAAQDLNIPESGNGVPDILNEALWNLEWMLDMQDPSDGGVYHKLTSLNFPDVRMPHTAITQRYVIGKGTAAALNFAAVMAMASRIYANYESELPGLAAQMLEAAEAAWGWAQANPNVSFRNPPDVRTGEYGSSDLGSTRAWAATELYITTGNDDYYTQGNVEARQNSFPGWTQSDGLTWMSLAHHRENLTSIANRDLIADRIDSLASNLQNTWQRSAYRVSINQFYWGSNSVALNQAMMLLQGYRLDPGNSDYLRAAQSILDYVLGRNATDYSFVTGHGSRTPMHPHHRVSEADDVLPPVPGFVIGGPQPQNQNDCGAANYPSDIPAKAYLDDWCSYSTNEVAINWNAPLVYVSGALQVLTPD